jgi:hypothetical protein
MALFHGGSRFVSPLAPAPALASRWIQWLARFGYAARGIVYSVIGVLALQAAVSSVKGPEDSSGALLAILRQPFGRFLLVALAGGLAAWVLWRLFQALLDPENLGTGAKGIAKRAGYLISAGIYGALAVEAVRLWMGSSSGSGNGESEADHWTAVVMSQPAGRLIIAAIAAGIVMFGVYELYRAYTADFRRALDLQRLGARGQRRIVLAGRLGMAARGIVFGIIGWFLGRAALQYEPSEARGFETALQSLQEQGYGQYLLAAVGVGLLCYGLFELAEARFRVIRPL